MKYLFIPILTLVLIPFSAQAVQIKAPYVPLAAPMTNYVSVASDDNLSVTMTGFYLRAGGSDNFIDKVEVVLPNTTPNTNLVINKPTLIIGGGNGTSTQIDDVSLQDNVNMSDISP